MNANQSATMYETVPVVSELNKVQGFDPLKFLRRTSKGDRKLDLKYKKLWFRLKYPNGRIKLSSLKITDQLAIIEARVYFDKNDTQPRSSFTAQRDAKTTPGGLYIEAAQHAAIDEALSDAGFGVQFTSADPNRHIQTEPQAVSEQPIIQAVEKTEPTSVATSEPIAKVVEEPVVEPMIETPIAQEIVREPVAAEPTVQEQPEPVVETPVTEVVATTADAIVGTIEPVETVAESVAEAEGEEIEEDVSSSEAEAPLYTADMPVEEICSMMTYDEACNVLVPLGTCKNWTMQQVAERRPASLKWYISGYNGDDNILRAAARIMQAGIDEMRKAS